MTKVQQRFQTTIPAAIELLEDRTLLASQIVDLGSLRFDGEFVQSGNTYTATSDVQIGLIPAGAEAFQPLLELTVLPGGEVTFTTDTSDPSFMVDDVTLSSIVQSNPDQIAIWSTADAVTFDADLLAGSGIALSSGTVHSFDLFGGAMSAQTIRLENPGTTDGAEVVLEGNWTISGQGDLTVALGTSNPLRINRNGPSVADFQADVSESFTLLDLKFDPTDITLSYASASQTFSIWGAGMLSTAGSDAVTFNASLGSASEPGITILQGDVSQFAIRLEGGATEIFKLKLNTYDLTLALDPTSGRVTGYGGVNLVGPSDGLSISGNVGAADAPGLMLQSGQIEQLKIDINGTFAIGPVVFQIKDATIGYVSDTTFELTGTLEVPELFDASVTLASPNGLTIRDGKFHLDGLTISLTDVFLGAFVLDELKVGYSDNNGEIDVDVDAKLWFPGAFTVEAIFDFENGKLNNVGVDYKAAGPAGIEIGDTGLQIVGLGGELQNLVHPRDLIFSGSIVLTYGPKETIKAFGEEVSATLLQLDGSLLVDRHELRAEVDAYIGAYTLGDSTSGLLGEVKGIATLDWSDEKYEIELEGGYYDGTFKGKLAGNFQEDLFSVFADLEVDIPDSVPFIGGDTIGSLDFALLDVFGHTDESFLAAWAKINLLIHHFDIGFEYTFDGDFKIINGHEIDHIEHEVEHPEPQVYYYASTHTIPAGATHATFHVAWDEAAGNQSIAIVPAGYTDPIEASDFAMYQDFGDSPGLSIVPAFTTETSIGVHIVGEVGQPDGTLTAGAYRLILRSDTELSPTWTSVYGFTPPTVRLGPLTDANPSISPAQVPIFTTNEPIFFDQTKVTLYVDTDATGYNGRPVTGATNVPIPPVSQNEEWYLPWDFTGLNEQPYYLYAVINDGFNSPVKSEYIGPFTPVPSIGGTVSDPKHDGAPVHGVTVFLDIDGNGQYDPGTDPHDITNDDGRYAFFDLDFLPGLNEYNVGIVVPGGFQVDPSSAAEFAVEYYGDPLTVDFQINEFASINGTVFVDANSNGTFDPGETTLSGWTVYLDTNDNARIDEGEVIAHTNSQGAYAFYSVTTDTSYTVRRVLQPGYYDTGEATTHTVSIGSDPFQKVVGLDFGVLPFSTISGNISGHELANGVLNPDTPPLDGWMVFVTQQTALNAGGAASGAYGVDADFSGGQDVTFVHSINTSLVSDPAPLSVYQSSRTGIQSNPFSYQVTGLTPHAPYEVRLDFVETFWDDPGDRIFNVAINGQTVLEKFDILATALGQGVGTGKFVALARTFTTRADSNGTVTIDFSADTDNALVNGIVVSALNTSLAINSGGVVEGTFGADGEFTGGEMGEMSTNSITTTGVPAPAPQKVYQTSRYGEHMQYTLTGLTAGTPYAVRLHFAETFAKAPGERLFDVQVNGETVLSSFDIFATAGGQNVATVQTFNAIANSDGEIVVNFTGVVGNASINGIEVIGGSVMALTDAAGNYSVGGLRFGNYAVSQVLPNAWREVSPFTSDLILSTPTGSDVQTVPGGVQALPPAIGDFDSDGKLDFAVADTDGNVLVYHNGDLDNPTTYPIIGGSVVALASADLIGTGRAGIAVLNEVGGIDYLRNDGPGKKLVNIGQIFFLDTSAQYTLRIVGMDAGFFVPGDGGEQQLAVTYQVTDSNGVTSNLVTVFAYRDGESVQVDLYEEFGALYTPRSIAAGDVNRDGFDDLLIGSDEQSPLLVYGNAMNLIVRLDELPAGGPVVLGDINSDGFLDAGVFGVSDQLFYYAIQTSSGLFPSAVASGVGHSVYAVNGAVLTDVNGDLRPDLVAALEGSSAALLVGLNSGSQGAWFTPAGQSTFTLPQDTAGGPQGLAVADLDGDALPDLIVVDSETDIAQVVRNHSLTIPTPNVTTLDGENVANLDFVNAQIGQINGRSFDDVTRSGNPGLGQPGRGGDTVYVDLNRNGRLDAGEPRTQTADSGHYAFDGLSPGTYLVRLVVPDGRRQTHPQAEGYEFVVGAGSMPVLDAHFGTTVALDVTWTIPDDSGTADWTIVRNGERIEVLDADLGVVAWEQLADIESITIVGAGGRANRLTIDMTAGGRFALPGGLTFRGTGSDDRLHVLLGSDNNQVTVDGSQATIDEFDLSWSKVAHLQIAAGEGNNQFVVSGRPVTSRGFVELHAGLGDDTYDLATRSTSIRIVDEAGADTIDFQRSTIGKRIRLSSDGGRWQVLDWLGNRVALEGSIENVVGTKHADFLTGSDASNRVDGLGGRDHLFGLDGDDLLLGGSSKDVIVGGSGNDLLIGGDGRDRILGERGEDVLIGGATTLDTDTTALAALLAEWTSGRDYATRIANLTDGTGSSDRLNGPWFFDSDSVIDDRSPDLLLGGRDRDWFLIGQGDSAVDRRHDETVEKFTMVASNDDDTWWPFDRSRRRLDGVAGRCSRGNH